MTGTRTLEVGSSEQVCSFCPYVCIILFLLFHFSISQVSSASSPPSPVQTGEGLPLNVFSWASLAPDIVGLAAVNSIAGTLFGFSCRPRHRTATGATAVEWAALMDLMDEVVVLLGGEVPAAINEAAVRAGAGPIPCDQGWLCAKSRHSAASRPIL